MDQLITLTRNLTEIAELIRTHKAFSEYYTSEASGAMAKAMKDSDKMLKRAEDSQHIVERQTVAFKETLAELNLLTQKLK